MAGKRPYDDLETDYLEEENESGFLSLVSIVIAFIAVAVFIALAWYAYQSSQSSNAEEIEVVYPEEGAIRKAPEETGGWQFPHQDKSVYNIVSGEEETNDDAKVEQILPAPEQPMAREKEATNTWMNGKLKQDAVAPTDAERLKQAEALKEAEAQIAAAEAETSARISEVQEAEPAVAETIKPIEEAAPATIKQVVKQEEKPAPVAVAKPIAKAVPKPDPVTPKAAPVATATGTAKLQLGAVSSEAEARTQWNRIRARFNVLSNKTLFIQPVAVNGKTLYRIQASGFASRNDAKAACSQMSAAKQACFPVGN